MGPENDLDSGYVKERINSLLWTLAPGSTTLREAEEIAVRWFQELQSLRAAEAERGKSQLQADESSKWANSPGSSGRFA